MNKHPIREAWPIWPTERATSIRMVVLDVDGVLTDGSIYFDENGLESKRFHVRDGMGIRLLLQADFIVGVLTARQSTMVTQRAKELSLSFVHQGVKDKWACLQHELEKAALSAKQCAYMGDDLLDLRVLQHVGLATAPADADSEVRNRVHWVATQKGGKGAVRELAKNLLHTQKKWHAIVSTFVVEEPGEPLPSPTHFVKNTPPGREA